MYYIYQQQSGGYDQTMKYYKTEKVFKEHLKEFLKAWVYLRPFKHSDDSDTSNDSDTSDDDEVYTKKENYNIEDVIKNMWVTTYITIQDEYGFNTLDWGRIEFEDEDK